MYKSLSENVAVITGGAAGIGFAIAEQFLQNNLKNVIILDINEQLGEEAVNYLNSKYGSNKAVFIKCDVTKNLEEVSKYIFESYKTIDILVNNAGILDEAAITKSVDINFKAVIEWSMAFFNYMRKDKGGEGGTIINMCSISGYTIQNFAPIYQATKFGVYGFTKSLGHLSHYDSTGVRVIGVCPALTDTDLSASLKIWDVAAEKKIHEDINHIPSQKPVDVGRATVEVFLKAPSGTLWTIEEAKPIFEV